MGGRLTPDQAAAQRAITMALKTAECNRGDSRRHGACIDYAAKMIDEMRRGLDTVKPSDRLTL